MLFWFVNFTHHFFVKHFKIFLPNILPTIFLCLTIEKALPTSFSLLDHPITVIFVVLKIYYAGVYVELFRTHKDFFAQQELPCLLMPLSCSCPVLLMPLSCPAHVLSCSCPCPAHAPVLLRSERLQSGQHKQYMKDLFVELCLTVPVRLSSLLPYLHMLMDPLVSWSLPTAPQVLLHLLQTGSFDLWTHFSLAA